MHLFILCVRAFIRPDTLPTTCADILAFDHDQVNFLFAMGDQTMFQRLASEPGPSDRLLWHKFLPRWGHSPRLCIELLVCLPLSL